MQVAGMVAPGSISGSELEPPEEAGGVVAGGAGGGGAGAGAGAGGGGGGGGGGV